MAKRTKKSEQVADVVCVLRCVPPSMRTTNEFLWPESGPVECPDWQPHAECGNGLHGWLWGEGDLSASGGVWEMPDAKWLVVCVAKKDVVELGGKVKYPRGEVVFCGTREAAANKICELGASGSVHFATRAAGNHGTATAGDYGTATAGNYGTATAGYSGTATAGDYGTATAGYSGTATAGYSGTATAGNLGTVAIRWYDAKQERYRLAIGEVGIDGIAANVAYVVRDGKIARRDPA